MVTIIVAQNANGIIGTKDNAIPWRIPEDMEFFKNYTMGKIVLMGRYTWDSLPKKFKPLPGRINAIISKKERSEIEFITDECLLYGSLDGALSQLSRNYDTEICVIGGAKVYKEAIDRGFVDKVVSSEVKGYLDIDSNVVFPNLKYRVGWSCRKINEFKDFDVFEYRK